MPIFNGTSGDDIIDGSVDPDQIYGLEGDDVLYGHGSGDEIYGDDGDDSLVGGDGEDTLEGGADDDTLHGGADNDTLNGGTGNDLLDGGTGQDSMNGGAGDDTVMGGEGADLIRGEQGSDVLDYSQSGAGVTINLQDQSTNDIGGGITAAIGSGGDAEGDVVRGIDNLVGSDHDDVLTLNDASVSGVDNTFAHGGAGNDSITGGDGDNLLTGGTGEDTIFGADGNDSIDGNEGDDLIIGGAGDDTMNGGDGNDTIGGTPTNLIQNGSFEDGTHQANGVNGLDGWSNTSGSPDSADDGTSAESWNPANTSTDGTGYITMWARNSSGQEAMQQTLDAPLLAGGSYTMTLNAISADYVGGQWFTPTDIPVEFELVDAATGAVLGSVTVQGTSYEEYSFTFSPTTDVSTIIIRPMGVGEGTYPSIIMDELQLVDNSETVGDDGDDLIDGGAGDDLIHAGAGDDTVDGGADNDTISGGAGEDLIDGGSGDDVIDGGGDDDTISGGDGADSINGGQGDDLIHGNAGDDTLNGGDGNDTIGPDPSATNLIQNGSFEDGTHQANGVNGLDHWSNTSGSPDSADDGTSAESWNPANTSTDGTGYITMWARTNSGQEAMQQTLATPLEAGTTYTMSLNAVSADYVGGQWFTPTDIPVEFELVDAATGEVLGSVTVQGTTYEEYSFTFTPDVDVSTIIIRPMGVGEGTYPSIIMDELELVEGTGAEDEAGNDLIDGGAGDDLINAGTGDDTITGGSGDDTIHGGAGDDVIHANDGSTGTDTIYGGGGADTIFANGDDHVDGGSSGTDADVLDLSGSGLPGGSLNVVITGADSNGNGYDGYVEFFDEFGVLQHTLTFEEIETIIPCFTPGTMIKTAHGEMPVEDLKAGDLVLTRDHGYQRLAWVGAKTVRGKDLTAAPDLCPIRIGKGALGNGLPERDMLVSPQHRMLVNSWRAALFFGESEVLVPAKHMTCLENVSPAEVEDVTYIHIMCDAHEIVCADGAWSESFQPGDRTLGAEDSEIRAELAKLFPELDIAGIKQRFATARISLKQHEARVLLQAD